MSVGYKFSMGVFEVRYLENLGDEKFEIIIKYAPFFGNNFGGSAVFLFPMFRCRTFF